MIKSSDYSFKQMLFVIIKELAITEGTETHNKKKGNYNNNVFKYWTELQTFLDVHSIEAGKIHEEHIVYILIFKSFNQIASSVLTSCLLISYLPVIFTYVSWKPL